MEAIIGGMLGGVVVLLVGRCKTIFGAAALLSRHRELAYSAAAFACSEAVERIKDLAIESKMEFEAEQAATEEVRSKAAEATSVDLGKKGGYLH